MVLILLCKIYKEGYYIPWGEEQCLIFANKTGKEADAEEVQGIIEIMIEKGMIDRGRMAGTFGDKSIYEGRKTAGQGEEKIV